MNMNNIYVQFVFAVIGVLIYLKGYLPVKSNEGVVVEPPKFIKEHEFNETIYKPEIERLVLIVIDALREDFVNGMPYSAGESDCVFGVKVEAPTVTLPRIKALTTGTVPQFVDVVLNLGAAVKVDDSFLHGLHRAGKKIVFYGDDTWVKAFGDLFERSDGTTSFFVNDFTEVDQNVTRHIDDEINSNDWDVMILHYLGLDHIGHVWGPFSPLIAPKLFEMDEVIKRIHESSKGWNRKSLILVTGDHGMKDSGSHGGTTHAETHVPLITFGNVRCTTKEIAQTDIPPTISALFGMTLPADSIGRILIEFFPFDETKILFLSYYNVIALAGGCRQIENVIETHLNYTRKIDTFERSLELYAACLAEINETLLKTSIEQNVLNLLFGILLVASAALLKSKLNIIFIIAFYFYPSLSIVLISINLVLNVKKFKFNFNLPLILHALLLTASSFIEEEHQIFYFYLTTAGLIMGYLNRSIYPPLSALILRLIRGLNSVGDRYASYPDVQDYFSQNTLYLKFFYAFSLVAIFVSITPLKRVSFDWLITAGILGVIFFYKFWLTSTSMAQFVWGLIALNGVYLTVVRSPRKGVKIFVLITTLLLRPHNAILLPAAFFIFESFQEAKFHFLLTSSFFFLQGQCNTIASIDLAPGYTGLNHYEPTLVGLLTLTHIYTFQILFFLLKPESEHLINSITSRLVIALTVLIVTFVQRNHLFVWSVFAPKLLIEACHIIFLFAQTSVYFVYIKIKYLTG